MSNSIFIQGFQKPKQFVKTWSENYNYGNKSIKHFYDEYIGNPFENTTNLEKLFQWKNGTAPIAKNKQPLVDSFKSKIKLLQALQINFDWRKFETEFEPQNNGAIWKIFLLHLIDAERFPIFDQHVYRSFCFFQNGAIKKNLTTTENAKWNIYKNDYLPWFFKIKNNHDLITRDMDKAFFTYGKMLKGLHGLPITIQ